MSRPILLVLLTLSLLGQQMRDAQLPRPSQSGTATIAGRVINAIDGQPLRRVQLTLRDENSAVVGGRLAMTDDRGQFAFRNLPAGRFQLSATKPPFLPMSYGMKRPARPGGTPTGSSIVLADAEQINVEMKLTRGGVITGIVRDASGQPAGNVRVSAMAFTRVAGLEERALSNAGGATSDDRGVYRIYGLAPGEYVVGVSSVGMSAAELAVLRVDDVRRADELLRSGQPATGSAASASPRPQTVGFVPVYHPGTTVVADATVLLLAPGEEKGGVDFPLQYVSTGRVTGKVTGLDGKPAAGASVRLLSQTAAPTTEIWSTAANVTDQEGRYFVAGVAPGRYSMTVRGSTTANRGTAPPWAQAEFTVNGDDHQIDVTLQPAMMVSGRVVFDGTTPPPDVSRVEVILATDRGPRDPFNQAFARPDTAGKFSIAVTPGRYRVSGGTVVPGWTLRSAAIGGVDALESAFEVRAGGDISDAVVTFTDRVTEISGRLVDGNNAPVPDFTVIVFPVDSRLWPMGSAQRIQGMRPGQDGRFTFRNLLPGEYFIGAGDDVERNDWLDPSFLKAMTAGNPVKITVAEGEKKSQDLRVK